MKAGQSAAAQRAGTGVVSILVEVKLVLVLPIEVKPLPILVGLVLVNLVLVKLVLVKLVRSAARRGLPFLARRPSPGAACTRRRRKTPNRSLPAAATLGVRA